jgi:ABC-type uncharacterized transport system involved in gliding motility auxiliary subunit
MTRKQTTIITLLSIVAFILALLVSGRFWFRLDMTSNKSHTISQVSRNLHRELPDPVNITFYLSNRLRTVSPVPGEIEDMLREYAAHSRGKIRLSVYDPVRAGLLGTVEAFGLQARQLPIVEQDQTSFITVYSGIVIEYLDRVEVLPWVISTDTLEYDLTSRIRTMVTETERWIGVIVGDSFRQWREDYSFLHTTLANAGYRIRLIPPGDEIPEHTPGLFVLGGADELDDWALYRIDRYIQQGGKVLFAVEGVFVDTIQGSLQASFHEAPLLLDMIASYGVIVRQELALDRSALTLQYQTRLPNGAIQFRIARYPLWIGVLGSNGNPEHPVTSGFQGLDLYWASPLELHYVDGVEPTVLFASTNEAWSMRENLVTSPEIPDMLEAEIQETRGQKILGASLRGIMPGFFRGAPKPVREGSAEELPDMPEQTREARVIVIGDTDFATNTINTTQARHNLDFLLRVTDWLVSDDDVISIRNRQPQIGRFDRIADPVARTAAMRFSQILNVGIVPFLVIMAGLIRASRRRRSVISADTGDEVSRFETKIEPKKESSNDI